MRDYTEIERAREKPILLRFLEDYRERFPYFGFHAFLKQDVEKLLANYTGWEYMYDFIQFAASCQIEIQCVISPNLANLI